MRNACINTLDTLKMNIIPKIHKSSTINLEIRFSITKKWRELLQSKNVRYRTIGVRQHFPIRTFAIGYTLTPSGCYSTLMHALFRPCIHSLFMSWSIDVNRPRSVSEPSCVAVMESESSGAAAVRMRPRHEGAIGGPIGFYKTGRNRTRARLSSQQWHVIVAWMGLFGHRYRWQDNQPIVALVNAFEFRCQVSI